MDQNLAEGVVIRPANAREVVRLVPGKTQRGGRSMFKRKIAEFSEIAHSKGGTARSRELLGGGCAEFSKKQETYKQPTREDLVWYEAAARLNEQRVDSAVSKTGVVDGRAAPCVQNAKFDEIIELVRHVVVCVCFLLCCSSLQRADDSGGLIELCYLLSWMLTARFLAISKKSSAMSSTHSKHTSASES